MTSEDKKRIIAELKIPENAQPFWLLKKYKPDHAAVLKDYAGWPNLLSVNRTCRTFSFLTAEPEDWENGYYILKPDYQLEPEYEWFDVELYNGYYQAESRSVSAWLQQPGFRGFWWNEQRVAPDWVVETAESGQTVRVKVKKHN